MIKSLIRILTFLKPYMKSQVIAAIILLLVVGIDLLIPLQMQRIIDVGIAASDTRAVLNIALIMGGLALLSAVLMIANSWYAVSVSQHFAADLRSALYQKIQFFSFGNLDDFQTGELLVRLTSDVSMIQQVVMMSMRLLLRAPLMMIGSLILLLITSPQLAIVLFILLPLTFVLVGIFTAKSQPLYKAAQEKLGRLNTVLQENLAGARVVKAFVRANHEIQRFDRANNDLMSVNISVNQLMALLLPSMIVLLNIGIAAVIWFGGNMAIKGNLTTGEIVAFINYLLFTLIPVVLLGMILPQVSAADASASRILAVLDTNVEIQELPNAKSTTDLKGRVCFENVWFSYNGDKRKDAVLKNINLVAEPGETIAILGQTGSGKSSLVHLIPRFYDVTEGRVTLDGVDVRDLTEESLRRQISIALQESVLFSGTILDNIRYGRPDATQDDAINASKAAQAHGFITSMPDGYNTSVGQRGTGLSGGQKQRIAIARALLTQPIVLILDDSTSAVDVETESKIQEALEELMRDRTSFVIAQRVSTVLTADKIVLLDKGEIVAIGTHTELLVSSPLYQEIYESQLGGDHNA
jgi:ATP-binding cassette, subfamily B, multidrug efflux pump